MTPATGTALVVLVAFVLPGFVCVLFQERTFKSSDDTTPLDRLLRAVYYSLWCYLLLAAVALIFGLDRAWFIQLYDRHQDDPAQLAWRAALALLLPAAAVWLSTLIWHESGANAWVLRHVGLNARHRQPTAWDFFFRQRVWVHVRVEFTDRTVWGYYGTRSFASYAKDGRDLFLEYIFPETKDSEDDSRWFGTWNEHNRGGWVNLEDAICVEFYSLEDAAESPTEEGPRAQARRAGRAEKGTVETTSAPATPSAPAEAEGKLSSG